MPSSKSKKLGEVEIKIRYEIAGAECLVFNRYSIRAGDDFLWIHLGYCSGGSERLLFKGAMCLEDARGAIVPFKDYIAQIGPPANPVTDCALDHDAWATEPPVSFNNLGLATHGSCGELLFSAHSHKMAVDSARNPDNDAPIPAKILGLFTSTRDLHKKLVIDYIEALQK